ncbi:hypothetical protein PCASD_09320 [Puccinia coronata f. sp. avenae]|uniref:Uncharacterized protein n=1 Tax=Puccinia coronata f. sp. avenae TaxID=200324 RepID=A0A2N5USH6_9BASI|nr:hypothetical protein PCASD_09320 [Puccinia coronata f. sp. avenae]
MDKSVTTCHSAFQWVVKQRGFLSLQLANFKDDEIKFNDFLKDLEVKLSCQAKTQVQLASTARALAVSQPPTSSPGQPSLAPARIPLLLHPNVPPAIIVEELEHYQRVLNRAKSCSNQTASLGISTGLGDFIILDSGASGHFLKHKAYFHHLSEHPLLFLGLMEPLFPSLVLSLPPSTPWLVPCISVWPTTPLNSPTPSFCSPTTLA